MNWEEFLKKTEKLPVIYTENLYAGNADIPSMEVQISRWKKSGKIIQLKRGIYLVAEPYRKPSLHELHLGSILTEPSYVSLEKALEYHNLIPEAVSSYTLITTKRPQTIKTKVGVFNYRHIKPNLFWGYNSVTVDKQTAFVATPEKALLDFFYFKRVVISMEYIHELRLQNLECVDTKKLIEFAKKFKKPKILKAAVIIKDFITSTLSKEKKL